MSSNKTEKPTPRRLQKAREKGDFPAAREFVSAAQFLGFVLLAASYFTGWIGQLQSMMKIGIRQAFAGSLDLNQFRMLASQALAPLAIFGGALMALTFLLQMGATNMGFSLSRIAPQFSRLSPGSRLKEIPSNNMAQFLQALVMMPVMLWLTWSMVRERLPELMRLPMLPVASAAGTAGMLIRDGLRKSAMVLFVLGAVMLVRERSRYAKRLRMSKEDIRDESKESEGNPQIKARVRKIQRDMRRKNMMREVPTATAVIVNPTHYAIAIRYEQGSMVAPLVVAKGKNYLAARIRAKALENQVPIIENPPLAQALYKSVDIGQEIPPHLYRAVAEILAYIFRLMNSQGRRS